MTILSTGAAAARPERTRPLSRAVAPARASEAGLGPARCPRALHHDEIVRRDECVRIDLGELCRLGYPCPVLVVEQLAGLLVADDVVAVIDGLFAGREVSAASGPACSPTNTELSSSNTSSNGAKSLMVSADLSSSKANTSLPSPPSSRSRPAPFTGSPLTVHQRPAGPYLRMIYAAILTMLLFESLQQV
jgi:hypothetical protein